MRTPRPIAAFVFPLVLALAAGTAVAAEEEPSKGPKELLGLEYRLIGPPAGGRVSRVAGVPGDPLTYYAATASGGVWKSVDGGITWKPVFDDQPTSSIGSIAVAPSDPNVVYVGSGEANIRGNVAQGDGIYKSVDAGKTWQHVWTQDGQIGTMVVHPKRPGRRLRGGARQALRPEPGARRLPHAGRRKTWEQGSDVGPRHRRLRRGARSANPRVVFAGLWQARRRPWELVSGGPGSRAPRLARRRRHLEEARPERGCPRGSGARWESRWRPPTRGASTRSIEAEKGGLFRSDDGGETWALASGHRALRQRAWYYTTLTVDPRNADVAWFPQVPMLKTVDGGKTIKSVKGIHHARPPRPVDRPRRTRADDRGQRRRGRRLDRTAARPGTRRRCPSRQFYHVAVGQLAFRTASSARMQDLGTASGPSNSLLLGRHRSWPTGTRWAAERRATRWPTRPTRRSSTPASTSASSPATTDARARPATSRAWPDNPSGHGASSRGTGSSGRRRSRSRRTTPKTVYHGANVLFRTQRRRPELDADERRPDPRRQDEAAVVGRPHHRRQHRRRVLLHDLRGRRVAARRRGSSGPAPTTAWSSSRATAARPGRT